MEAVGDDPHLGQDRPDRLTVSFKGVDRNHLDRFSLCVCERAQVVRYRGFGAAVEDFGHAAAIEVGDDRHQLVSAPVMGLIERQPSYRLRLQATPQGKLGTVFEGPADLVVGGLLGAGDPRRGRRPRRPARAAIFETAGSPAGG